MENAIKYVEQMQRLVDILATSYTSTEIQKGRRFDKVILDKRVRYFVEHDTCNIFGAKSAWQYNPRREYGTLDTIEQYDWTTGQPLKETAAYAANSLRESIITKNYKKRGRPRKVVAP